MDRRGPGAKVAPMRILPLSFDIRDRPVLVIGTGEMAEARTRLVAAAGGRPVRLAPDALGTALPADIAPVAFVAVEARGSAEQWATRLRARGLAVNVTDRPDLCDFQVPAIIDRGSVSIAIATGGRSASLARVLRERLEAWLPARLGALADAIAARRGDVARHAATTGARRAFWDRLLAPGGALDPFGDAADPDAAITAALAGGDARPADELHDLALASPDPEELALRQLRLLQRADWLVHAPDVPAAVLDRARRDAARIPLAGDAPVPSGLSGVVVRIRMKHDAH